MLMLDSQRPRDGSAGQAAWLHRMDYRPPQRSVQHRTSGAAPGVPPQTVISRDLHHDLKQ